MSRAATQSAWGKTLCAVGMLEEGEGRKEFGDRRDRTTGDPERDKLGERSMKDRVEGPTVGPGRGIGK